LQQHNAILDKCNLSFFMLKRIIILLILLVAFKGSFGAVLWSQDFTSGTTGFYTTSGMTRNAGSTYACTFGNYIFYTSNTRAYVETNTINVGQGKGIRLSFDSRRINSLSGSIVVYYLITGSCSWSYLTPNNNGWVQWGTITPNTSTSSPGGCTNQILQLESHVCGGQNIAILMYFGSASSTNWIAIDNLVVDDLGPTSVAVPNITGATTYTENFTTDKWYGPVSTGNYSTTGAQVPYHSYRSSSTAYTYLWNNGSNGTANHSGVWADYFAAFYTGFEFCNSSGASQIITKELNTSACANPEIKFAYKAKYPCTVGNYSYTFDESYYLYAPELYTSIGQGYTWIQRPVNYYFPDGLWHFACYSLPSSANIKVKFERGGSCSNPVEGVDHIKVLCRDCSISALSGGTITGESNPGPNTNYTYTITPTSGATYYKWMIRAIDRIPPIVIEAACPNGTDPCIVSGQGTTSVVINFGSLLEHYRVMCIPYDANPGTLTNPSDACYAEISLFPTTVLPVELTYFKAEQVGENLELQWQTASETNNDFFEVQQSQNGITFTTIARIDGAGNSNSLRNYLFTVTQLFSGQNYFRLQQVDFDGTDSYSEIISVINESPEEGIQVNISNGQILLYTEKDILYPLYIEIFDMLGRRVFFADEIVLGQGQTTTFITSLSLNGLYFIRIKGIGVDIKKSTYISAD
jgi:hypothetical protein